VTVEDKIPQVAAYGSTKTRRRREARDNSSFEKRIQVDHKSMNNVAPQKNSHIRKYLDYYFALPIAPHYAVMIKGPWGSGKTHLIKNLVETTKMKTLYVSLNGISSTKEIEAEFFRQLHPVLSNPKVKLLGKLVQGALKVNLSFDAYGDTKPDGSIQTAVPDLDLSKYAGSPERVCLIFDDLERCQLPIIQVLGYINFFVEHGECKVLVLADDDRIEKNNSVSPDAPYDYAKIREKVIGTILEVELDVRTAIKSFAKAVSNQHAQAAILENIEFIESIFSASSFKNLRHLRQALLDYSRIIDEIQLSTYKPDMMRSLLGTLFMYSLETRSGDLDPRHIGHLRQLAFMHAANKEEGLSAASIIENKYSKLGVMNSFIPDAHWNDFFTKGAFPVGSVNEHILRSEYYAKPAERPIWLRLYEMYRSDDEPLKEALIQADLLHRESTFASIAELLNVTGSLLSLSSHGVYQVPQNEIIENAKKCIIALGRQGAFVSEKLDRDYDHQSTFGYFHHSRDTAEYKEVIEFLTKAYSEAEIERYPNEAKELLELLGSNTDEFVRRLNLESNDELGYLSKPILKYVELSSFVDHLRSMKATCISKVSKAFRDRYKYLPFEVVEEHIWLEECAKAVEMIASQRSGTMAAHWLHQLAKIAQETAAGLKDRRAHQQELAK
jgi:hypothetical protein